MPPSTPTDSSEKKNAPIAKIGKFESSTEALKDFKVQREVLKVLFHLRNRIRNGVKIERHGKLSAAYRLNQRYNLNISPEQVNEFFLETLHTLKKNIHYGIVDLRLNPFELEDWLENYWELYKHCKCYEPFIKSLKENLYEGLDTSSDPSTSVDCDPDQVLIRHQLRAACRGTTKYQTQLRRAIYAFVTAIEEADEKDVASVSDLCFLVAQRL